MRAKTGLKWHTQREVKWQGLLHLFHIALTLFWAQIIHFIIVYLCHICYQYNSLFLSPWPESASELYRPSDRRLSAKLVPTLQIEGATWSA
jgi:hypothetical protein